MSPDWRDPDAYPRDQSLADWRWQFLRRLPAYWLYFDALKPELVNSYLDCATSQSFLMKRAPEGNPYGLEWALDPEAPTGAGLFPNPPLLSYGKDPKRAARLREQGLLAIYVDPHAAINDQLDKIRRLIEVHCSVRPGSREGQRQRRADWPRHLRVLDAHAAGVSLAEISRTLQPADAGCRHSDRGRGWLRAAQATQQRLCRP